MRIVVVTTALLVAFGALVAPSRAFAAPALDPLAAFMLKDFATTDFDAALKIWRPLAEGGDWRSEQALGAMYVGGLGVPRDIKLGIEWLTKAADQNDHVAELDLGLTYKNAVGFIDPVKSCQYYKRAAKGGLSDAQSFLAVCYLRGDGTPKDLARGYAWMTIAAESKAPAAFDPTEAKGFKSLEQESAKLIFGHLAPKEQDDATEFLLRCRTSNLQACD